MLMIILLTVSGNNKQPHFLKNIQKLLRLQSATNLLHANQHLCRKYNKTNNLYNNVQNRKKYSNLVENISTCLFFRNHNCIQWDNRRWEISSWSCKRVVCKNMSRMFDFSIFTKEDPSRRNNFNIPKRAHHW